MRSCLLFAAVCGISGFGLVGCGYDQAALSSSNSVPLASSGFYVHANLPSPLPMGGSAVGNAGNVGMVGGTAPYSARPSYYAAPAPCEEPMANSKTRAARR